MKQTVIFIVKTPNKINLFGTFFHQEKMLNLINTLKEIKSPHVKSKIHIKSIADNFFNFHITYKGEINGTGTKPKYHETVFEGRINKELYKNNILPMFVNCKV